VEQTQLLRYDRIINISGKQQTLTVQGFNALTQYALQGVIVLILLGAPGAHDCQAPPGRYAHTEAILPVQAENSEAGGSG